MKTAIISRKPEKSTKTAIYAPIEKSFIKKEIEFIS